MGRPVNANAEATRRRILESAIGLFSDHGLGGASIREIARGAGVSLAMVHHYFGSKNDLYEAAINSMYADLAELERELRFAIEEEAELGTFVEQAIRAGFRFARAHQPAVRLLMRSVVEVGELDEKRRREVQAPFLDYASVELSKHLGCAPRDLRLPLQSTVFLVARYAVSSPTELSLLTGASPDDSPEAAEDHLVRAALALLTRPNPHAIH